MNITWQKEKSFLIRLFKRHNCLSNFEMVESIPMGMIACKICGRLPNFLEAQGWMYINTEPYRLEIKDKKYVYKGVK